MSPPLEQVLCRGYRGLVPAGTRRGGGDGRARNASAIAISRSMTVLLPATNKNASWHCACVIAWQFWNSPSGQVRLLRRLQARRWAKPAGGYGRTPRLTTACRCFGCGANARTLRAGVARLLGACQTFNDQSRCPRRKKRDRGRGIDAPRRNQQSGANEPPVGSKQYLPAETQNYRSHPRGPCISTDAASSGPTATRVKPLLGDGWQRLRSRYEWARYRLVPRRSRVRGVKATLNELIDACADRSKGRRARPRQNA